MDLFNIFLLLVLLPSYILMEYHRFSIIHVLAFIHALVMVCIANGFTIDVVWSLTLPMILYIRIFIHSIIQEYKSSDSPFSCESDIEQKSKLYRMLVDQVPITCSSLFVSFCWMYFIVPLDLEMFSFALTVSTFVTVDLLLVMCLQSFVKSDSFLGGHNPFERFYALFILFIAFDAYSFVVIAFFFSSWKSYLFMISPYSLLQFLYLIDRVSLFTTESEVPQIPPKTISSNF